MANNSRADVIAKALKDPAFKAELLKNPAAAIEKATGVKVPAGVTIKVVEDNASTVHLVLPPAPPSGTLSDKELGKVAGGAQWFTSGHALCTDNSDKYVDYCKQ